MSTNDPSSNSSESDGQRFVVISQDGMGVASASEHDAGEQNAPEEDDNPANLVEHPAKVMRIGSMIKQLLEEVRSAPLDEAGRRRLADIHHRSIEELKDGIAPELVDELDRLALPFTEESPSEAELRIAQAQLVGWLEGLFHGIQTAIVAQQMAAQAQLQAMRRGLPPGQSGGHQQGMPQGMQPPGRGPGDSPTGQYL